MVPRTSTTRNAGTILGGVFGLMALLVFAGTLGAQVQQFNSTSLPAGWSMSPGNQGALWAIDGNPTREPYQNTAITPYRSAPYSLNYNNGTNTYNAQQNFGGVMTEEYDITFAPDPKLEFWMMQHCYYYYYTQQYYHVAKVRIWDTNRSVLHKEELVSSTTQRLNNWSKKTIAMNKSWGKVRVEFYFDNVYWYSYNDQNSAGWFIDDVEVTGLTPPTMAIMTDPNLPAVSAGSSSSVVFQADNGTTPYVNWRITGGVLPAGMTVNSSTGALEGNADQNSSGSYAFEVSCDDSGTLSDSKWFYMDVIRPANFTYPVGTLPWTDDFSSDQGWVFSTNDVSYGSSLGNYSDLSSGGWERGAAQVSSKGSWYSDEGDPGTDRSSGPDNMILGVGIGDLWPNTVNVNDWHWAYSPEIDVEGFRAVEVSFWKWINQYYYYLPARVELYNPTNGSWEQVWTHQSYYGENSWTQVVSDVDFGSDPGPGATTRVRFGWAVTSTYALTSNYSSGGFNVDDVKVIEKPQPGIVEIVHLEVVSPYQAGSTAKVYVGETYPVRLLVDNNSTHPVDITNWDHLFHLGGNSENVGTLNFQNNLPSTGNPWVIPGGATNFAISDAQGGGICPITFDCTALPSFGNGTSVILHVEMLGKEQGGQNRATISDSSLDPAGDEVISVFIPPPVELVDPAQLPDASENVPYSYTLTADHGTPPYHSWDVVAGPSMTWLQFDNANHRLHGTPPAGSAPGPVTVEIEVYDSSGGSNDRDSKVFSINIVNTGPQPLVITNASQLPNATRNQPYSAVTFNAAGGVPSYSWSGITWLPAPTGNGTLNGMSWDAGTATLSGTPTSPVGTYAFELTVTDSDTPTPSNTTQTFFISVLPENPSVGITTSTSAPPDGNETAPYNGGVPFQFEAVGGYQINGGYDWSVVGGQLPPGLSLNPETGEMGGIPDTPGTFDFTIRASDGAFPPSSDEKQFSVTIDPVVPVPLQIDTPSSLPDGDEGNFYSVQLAASWGQTPYTWHVKTGSQLPQGLGLDSITGEIAGTIFTGQVTTSPEEDFTFIVEVRDSSSPTAEVAEKSFTMTITEFVTGPIAITTDANLPQAGMLFPYETWIRASGGNPIDPANPYTFVLANGTSLPSGLSLDLNGRLSGTPGPGTNGDHTFDVEVDDANGNQDVKTFNLQINGFPPPDGQEAPENVDSGKQRTQTVPFWEACTVGTGSTGLTLLLLIGGLAAASLWMRRRTV